MSRDPDLGIPRVARAMLREFDDLMTLMTSRIHTAVPSYSELLLDRNDLSERNREYVLVVLTCLLEGRDPSDTELERSARNGERRAVQGVSQVAVIQSFRTAERALGEELTGWCTRLQVRHATARQGLTALVSHLDALERAMLDAYDEMSRRVRAEELLSEPALFRRLVAGDSVEATEVDRLATMLGVDDPDGTVFVAVAVAPVGGGDLSAVERLRHHVGARLAPVLRVPMLSGTVEQGGRHVALLALAWPHEPEGLVRDLSAALRVPRLRDPAHATIGEPRTGLSQLGSSCRQAVAALEATADGSAGGEVARYTDVLLQVLVRREPVLMHQLAERYLGGLAEHPDLLSTLAAYVEHDLALSPTAEALNVHKNTVVYRLRRIEELTGLDLRRSLDVARAVMALQAHAAHPHA